jgi:hypothetical protein
MVHFNYDTYELRHGLLDRGRGGHRIGTKSSKSGDCFFPWASPIYTLAELTSTGTSEEIILINIK